ncbi:Membrane carboxypeptidase (penicillin-binding protein) [Agrococcus baldri]|uniref:Membrane carboxypeptidase (Penicillin-binding protein) n=1 Tax=Agrococcus baldri TaxID=153730 RepID=A0AA94KZ28_9MICO|nr:transglycosylase domain-containing protein [Agrococcus baldri]SFS06565.1 Membrane carboxypeptidase (penicillin-binding protein) [Agrococcus baldri]
MAATRHKPGSLLGSILGLIGFSAIAGILISATLTPALAVASSTANSGLDLFESLPSYAQINQQAERNRIYGMRDGQPVEMAQFYAQDRQVLQWSDVPSNAVNALVAGEDRRFYTHGGVDAPSVIRAGMSQLGFGGDSGASTLTMQLVRMQIAIDACLADPEDEAAQATCAAQYTESYQRKLAEMRLAIGLEQVYTKNEIVLAYLNLANFGGNVYGIESGAQRIFGKPASELTVAEAAALIATVQNPSTRNLFNAENWPRNQERRDFIIGMMASEGHITAEQRDEAIAIPVDENFVNLQPANNGCIAGHDSARFFCDYVQRVLQNDKVDGHYILGAEQADNARALFQGGYRIYTSIDLSLNDANQAVVDAYAPNDYADWFGGAVTQLEVGTGRILSMVQNKDYDPRADPSLPEGEEAPSMTATAVNYNVDYRHGRSIGFQPGSGFKIFTLAQWIIDRHSVNEQVDATEENWTTGEFTASCNPGATAIAAGGWEPQNNEGNQYSRMTPTEIMVNSVNTGTLRMASQLDLCDVMDTAAAMGIERGDAGSISSITGEPIENNLVPMPSSVIGGAWPVTPMAMAEAFATISNGGIHCEPIAIDRIVARDGSEVAPPGQNCQQAITPEVASVMQLVLEEVTQRNPLNNPAGTTPVISKTGTTNGVRQTWVNGASPTVATSVWVGNIAGSNNLDDLNLWNVRSQIFRGVMTEAINRYPGGQFLTPDQDTLQGDANALPDVTGQSVADAQATLEAAGFEVQVADPIDGIQPSGMVEYTAPGAGSPVTTQTPIIIYPSNGALAPDAEQPEESTAPDAAGQTWPDLSAQSIGDARSTLASAGFNPDLMQVTWQDHGEANLCTVLAQNPLPDAPGGPNDPISVVVGTNASGGDPGC